MVYINVHEPAKVLGAIMLMAGVLFMVFYGLEWLISDTTAQRKFIDQCIVDQYDNTENRYAHAKVYCDALWRLQ